MFSRGNGLDSGLGADDGYESIGTKRQRSSMDLPPVGSAPWTALLPRAQLLGGVGGGPGGGYGSGSSAAAAAALLGARQQAHRSFPVVRLRGLPFNASELHVCEFFAGLDIVDVLLVNKQQHGGQAARFSGDAFVVFGAPTQMDYALQRNRMKIGKRYIEVFRSRKHDYYQAIAAHVADASSQDEFGGLGGGGYGGGGGGFGFGGGGGGGGGGGFGGGLGSGGGGGGRRMSTPPVGGKRSYSDRDHHVEYTGVLKLRGLPFSASKRDIMDFFRDYGELTEDSVHIMTLANGRASGEAFVEFATPAEAKAAMNKDKMILGSRYVDLFPSSRDEAKQRAASKR